MKTIKPMSISCSRKPVPVGEQVSLVVTAMAGLSMENGQPTLCGEQKLWKALGKVLPKGTAPDLGFHKPHAEWLAFGHAYPARPGAVSTRVRVSLQRQGRVMNEKNLHISGHRLWQSRLGVAWPGEPEPLPASVPLDWAHAYGGKGHAVNPQGVGYYGEEGWQHQPLPGIEYRDALISSPDDRPKPAGLGPLPLDAPGRWQPAGTYNEQWKREVFPALPLDTPDELFMLASADQWLQDGIEPGDIILCEGMSAGGGTVRWEIPRWQARCFIRLKGPGHPLIPLTMKADTLVLLPGEGLLGLIWRGTTPITEPDAFDVGLLMGALEDRDAPRPLDHYQALLAARSGLQKDALINSLDETPLLPKGQPGHLIPEIPRDLKDRMEATRKKAEQRIEKALGKPIADIRQAPPSQQAQDRVDPAHSQQAIVIAEEITRILTGPQPDGARLAVLIKQARALGDEARKVAIAKLEAVLKQQGLQAQDPSEALRRRASGPPARRQASLKRSFETAARQAGADEARLAKLRTQLGKLQTVADDRYRKAAHWMPPGYPRQDPQQLGDQLHGLIQSGQSARYSRSADWLGADLSGRTLDGAQLPGAFLDGANFSDASLVGANLRGATLSGANLMGADLTGADLEGSNLGGAFLQGARFHRANLKDAILDGANLDGAQFQEATLNKASLIGSLPGSADFSRANLTETQWLGLKAGSEWDPQIALNPPKDLDGLIKPLDMSGINASDAKLYNATLLGCHGQGARFSGARLGQATLVKCDLSRADFSRAVFRKSNVVMATRLQACNFTRAELVQSCFRETDLSQSDFRGARLQQSLFSLGKLDRINAEGVDATGARFERADLTEASFISARLTGARFKRAQLAGTCFQASDVSHADFSRAQIDDKTSFADATTLRALLPAKPGKA